MSSLLQKRWKKFRANRRGWWSLVLFMVLFTLALFSEFIANDKPIVLSYKGKLYFPVFHTYPETTFGGVFETETSYRDPYMVETITQDGWMFWPPVKYHYDTINYDLIRTLPASPDGENWLGTDDQGRDVVARLLYGFRISVLFGLALTVIGSLIGIAVGALQGYLGGWVDLILQRVIEIWGSLPLLMMLMILSSIVQPTIYWLLGVMVFASWTSLVRLVRAECLKTRNMDYVRAAKALGVKERTILFRHILPNSFVSALTAMPFILSASITTLTSLDYLGFGLPPGSPSLGELLQQGRANLQAPWLGISGFLVVAIMLSLLVFIGEAVRDAFDPRKSV